jgi:hypothetical protein
LVRSDKARHVWKGLVKSSAMKAIYLKRAVKRMPIKKFRTLCEHQSSVVISSISLFFTGDISPEGVIKTQKIWKKNK